MTLYFLPSFFRLRWIFNVIVGVVCVKYDHIASRKSIDNEMSKSRPFVVSRREIVNMFLKKVAFELGHLGSGPIMNV